MNFSRFFRYSLPFFLLCSLANTASPISFRDSVICFGQPLFFGIPKIPQANTLSYKSILIDKGNRLFITNDHEVFIYDGINTQRIKVAGNPIVAYDGKDRVIIAGDSYLTILTKNDSGEYSSKHIIDSLGHGLNKQISSIGFDIDKTIYFSTGSKLWRLEEKPIPIDSSNQSIKIYSTRSGLVFYSKTKGFYTIKGNTSKILNNKNTVPDVILKIVTSGDNLFALTPNYPWEYSINATSSTLPIGLKNYLKSFEKILQVSTTDSYIFITTSNNRLLMFDAHGALINIINTPGALGFELPVDICTTDDINFFAISPTQIYRFVNPLMVQVLDSREFLFGRVNSVKILGEKLFIATSNGLYTTKTLNNLRIFDLLYEGDFLELCLYNNNLFAISTNGLYLINKNHFNKIFSRSIDFEKPFFIDSKVPKAIYKDNKKIAYVNLNDPLKLIDLAYDNNTELTQIYKFDSLLFLNSSHKWFIGISINDRFEVKECKTILASKFNAIIIDDDTLCLFNNQIAKVEKSVHRTFVGKTFCDELITNSFNSFHPDYQILEVKAGDRKSNHSLYKSVIALDNGLRINSALIESDSSAWVSTNIGLIRYSKDYFNYLKTHPKIIAFSISSFNGEILNSIIYGFVQSSSISKNDIRVKQGSKVEINLSGTGRNEWNNLTYSYKLDGFKSNWTTNPKIQLGILSPGNYTYHFKARDVMGNESPELTISLRIIPNFFQTKFTLIALVFLFLLIVLTIVIYRNYHYALERFKLESIINRRTEELVKEKEKTDNLLARVLPRETATELKETGKVNTQKFNIATVLFSDIQGFTKITDELNPENLIDQLDKFFLYFDSVVDKYKIEKIKTIGDAYMCAGGIPHKNRTNPVEVVLAALEMMYFMREINLQHNPGQDLWDLRIGIDTGPVIAGVVGRNKLSYDIWGSTVNTASRMESSGEVGKINISGNTYIFVQDYFLCTYRGKMPIKNKGDIEMYFVEGIKPSLSNNLDIFRPNIEFLTQLQFLRFGDLEEFILEKLEKGLPKNLYYHNLKHTVDVYTQVELIGRSENVSQEEQLLLQTAALFHDAGHLIDYDTHEEMGVKLAREILPRYQYSERQIEIISDLIMVTKLPPKPKNLLEAIMCDADLDYLGRTDFIPVSNKLYKELHEHGRIGTIQEWNELQIKFIEKHQYFTNTARKLRNVNKNSQLDNIKQWIEKNKL
jgi:adenylate cyclase